MRSGPALAVSEGASVVLSESRFSDAEVGEARQTKGDKQGGVPASLDTWDPWPLSTVPTASTGPFHWGSHQSTFFLLSTSCSGDW